MDGQKIYGDNVEYITQLARDTFGDTMNKYYEGDPIVIPEADLPCVIVQKVRATADASSYTGFDKYEEVIGVSILMNKMDDMGGGDDDNDLTERKLRQIVEGRNQDGSYKAGTFMYAIRHHLTLVGTGYNADFELNYDVQERPNQMATSEAQILITARGNVPVGVRN